MNRSDPSPHPSPPVGERVPDLYAVARRAKAEGRVRGRPGSCSRFASNRWRFSLPMNRSFPMAPNLGALAQCIAPWDSSHTLRSVHRIQGAVQHRPSLNDRPMECGGSTPPWIPPAWHDRIVFSHEPDDGAPA